MVLRISLIFVFSIFLGVAIFLWGKGGLLSPTLVQQPTSIIIQKGRSVQEIAEELVEQKVITNPYMFYISAYSSGTASKLRAGEFIIQPGMRVIDLAPHFAYGQPVIRKVTFPEGITVQEVVQVLNSIPVLKGNIKNVPQEGYLLPETYHYTYGDQRQEIIDRMYKAMIETIESLWSARSRDVSLNNKHQVIILASIVEKETGITSERARVAAVYYNRLRIGMPLQADPTVVYGITQGGYKLDRPLSKTDLLTPTVFNTYTNRGLPPGAIACPGKEALKATLNPLKTQELYFVADGSGGHGFSATLDEHNKKVNQWRKYQRQQAQAQALQQAEQAQNISTYTTF